MEIVVRNGVHTAQSLQPHIVRRRELNEFNGRTLDGGTANSMYLRHAPETVTIQDSVSSYL